MKTLILKQLGALMLAIVMLTGLTMPAAAMTKVPQPLPHHEPCPYFEPNIGKLNALVRFPGARESYRFSLLEHEVQMALHEDGESSAIGSQGAGFNLRSDIASALPRAGRTYYDRSNAPTQWDENEVEIEVDIKPESAQPFINVASRTLVPLAILSTSAFDAPAKVDPASVRLADAPVKLNEAGDALCRSRDVNRDGLDDLLCHMQPAPHKLNVGTQMMSVVARTHDGDMLTGRSAIDVMPQGMTLGGMRALMLD